MAIFSAKYRPLAKDAFRCVFLRMTMRPCEVGLDQKIRIEIVSNIFERSPAAAKLVNRHFEAISWSMLIITVLSFAYSAYGLYNFYYYGNCEGPISTGACILNDITGDYGRFSEPKDLIAPKEMDGIASGNPNSSVTIVEFGCFTCSYTNKSEATVQELLKRYNDTIYYVFKPFLLPNHENSFEIARAVLCSNKQGKQWEFRGKVFENQKDCATGGVVALKILAQEAGLDMIEFNQCLDNNETGVELARYVQQGKDSHIYATPTFFINGEPLVGPRPISEFEKIIGR